MTRPTIIASDAEAQAIRDRIRREVEASRDPMECPPIEGPDGSFTWQMIEEVRDGMRIERRRRIDD